MVGEGGGGQVFFVCNVIMTWGGGREQGGCGEGQLGVDCIIQNFRSLSNNSPSIN